jgi:hypothetical protein
LVETWDWRGFVFSSWRRKEEKIIQSGAPVASFEVGGVGKRTGQTRHVIVEDGENMEEEC